MAKSKKSIKTICFLVLQGARKRFNSIFSPPPAESILTTSKKLGNLLAFSLAAQV